MTLIVNPKIEKTEMVSEGLLKDGKIILGTFKTITEAVCKCKCL